MQLYLSPSFAVELDSIEKQLSKKEFPILLFKNVVKRKEVQPGTLDTSQSTFIIPLRTKKPLDDLKSLLMSTKKV